MNCIGSRVVFLYSGQGPRWPGTGRQLFADDRWRRELTRCEVEFQRLGGWSLTELLGLQGDEPPAASPTAQRCNDTDVSQPAHFAYQVALTKWLDYHGVRPDVVFGHSMGEAAAAYASGALRFHDACRVIFHRGRVTHQTVGMGRMLWIALPQDPSRTLLQELGLNHVLDVTAVNEPGSCVVAGPTREIDTFVAELKQRALPCQLLGFNYGFHSPLMDPLKAELAASLAGIQPQLPAIPIVSTVSGRYVAGEELDPHYWARNIRDTVLFASAVAMLASEAPSIFIEVGPHALLTGSLEQCLRHAGTASPILGTLRRGENDLVALAELLDQFRSLMSTTQANHYSAREDLDPPSNPST